MVNQLLMAEELHSQSEVDEFIEDFVKEFYSKFGFSVVVVTESDVTKMPLPVLIDIVNNCLWTWVPQEEYPKGIKERTRKREIVIHRQIYMKIAKSWGYTLSTIGAPCGKDHATVLHADKTIRGLLEVNNKQVVKAHNCIINAIKERIRDDGDVQPDSDAGSNPE